MCAAFAACVQSTIIPEPYATETFSWRRAGTQRGVVKRGIGAMLPGWAPRRGAVVRTTQGVVFFFRRNHGVTVRRGLGGFFRASSDGCEMATPKKETLANHFFSITPACHPGHSGHSGRAKLFQPTGVAMGQCTALSSTYHATVHRPIMHPVISQSSCPLCLQTPLLPARLSPYPMAPDGDCCFR